MTFRADFDDTIVSQEDEYRTMHNVPHWMDLEDYEEEQGDETNRQREST